MYNQIFSLDFRLGENFYRISNAHRNIPLIFFLEGVCSEDYLKLFSAGSGVLNFPGLASDPLKFS